MTDVALDEMCIEKLPTIPHSLLKLLCLFEKPVVEFDELADIITQDAAITTRILHLGNTVYYRQWCEFTQIRRLLVVLGIDTVRHIALTSAIEHVFRQFGDVSSGAINHMWYRSLVCAYLAQELAELSGYSSKEEAYISGLLHRIGQLVLFSNNPQEYLEKVDITLDFASIEKIEHRQFRTSSVQIGTALIQHWQMPNFVADAIRFQNQSAEIVKESTPLVRIINLSRQLSDCENEISIAGLYTASMLFDLNQGLANQLLARAQKRAKAIVSCLIDASVDSETNVVESLQQHRGSADSQLSQQVKNHALTATLHNNLPSSDRQKIFTQIRRDFHLLFGFSDLCFLLTNATGDSLCGYDDQSDRPQLSQVVIQCDSSTSLAIQALQERIPMCLADSNIPVFSIPDRQLGNLMGSEAVCFVPLVSGAKDIGVVAVALSAKQWHQLADHLELLQLAAKLAADSLELRASVTLNGSNQEDGAGDNARIEQQIRAAIHEINNPLSIINNYLHLLAGKLSAEQQSVKEITIIQEEIGRVSTLVAGLRDLGQSKAAEQSAVDINLMLEQLHTLLSASLFQGRKQQLLLDLDRQLVPLTTCVDSLKQILVNLLKNASEALPTEGEVLLITRDNLYRNGGRFVAIEVRDNGGGIAPEILAKLYQPVTSTKENHAGLGLTIVKKLADQLNAELSCFSDKNGTSFQILLPRIEI